MLLRYVGNAILPMCGSLCGSSRARVALRAALAGYAAADGEGSEGAVEESRLKVDTKESLQLSSTSFHSAEVATSVLDAGVLEGRGAHVLKGHVGDRRAWMRRGSSPSCCM